MIGSDLQYFSQFYLKYDDSIFFQYISEKFMALDKIDELNAVPPGVLKSILETVFYIILRHKYWVHCEILKEATLEHIVNNFNLSRKIINKILDVTFKYGADFYSNYNEICSSEKDFLCTILIECVVQQSEENLIRSLGIGQVLVDKIHKAVDIACAIQLAEATAPLHFLPKIDFLVAEILQDFEAECQISNKKIPLYKIRYFLIKNNLFIQFFHNIFFLESLVDIFIECASSPPFTKRYFEKRGKNIVKDFRQAVNRDLFDELINLGLFCTHSSQLVREKKYELTSISKELIASTIVNSLLNIEKQEISVISKIDDIFQLEYINSIAKDQCRLQEFILHCRPLRPRSLNRSLRFLKEIVDSHVFINIVNSLKSTEKSVFIKKVVENFDECEDLNTVTIDQLGAHVAKLPDSTQEPSTAHPSS